MKPINIIVIVGSLGVAALGGWYMYMQSAPQYQKSAQRGLDPALFPSGAASTAPAAPSSAPAAPSSAPAAPSSAPAAPSSAPAAPSSAAGSVAPSTP